MNDYAIYLYYNPMSDAEATQRGIRTLNQNGEENPIYTQGKRPHSAAKSDKSIREHEAAGIKFEDAANNRAKLNELNAAQEAWKNVGTHPELLEEAKAEFDKTDEGAQQYFDFGANFSIQEAEIPVYTAINDNVGLQQHLNDIVEPIKINFTPAKKKGGDWVKEALDYYMQELAGQSLSIGNTGYTLHVKATKNRAKLATYNSNTQARSEAFKQIKVIIAKAYRLGSEHAESREKESKFRSNQIANTATFERFGYPVSIGGEVRMFWFTGQTKRENDTDVLFAESGLTEAQKGDTALTWSSQDATMPPSAITLGDALSNVKGKIKGVPQIIKNAPTANFSIQAASLPDRFAGHPLAERMSNFMRTEARRYERTLNLNSPDNAAVNAIAATQAIIHSLDKYVRNGEFRLPREAMTRLKHMRALIEKYAQMMKSGKIRSFTKIDKAEQSELLAAMAEAAADIDMGSINAMTPEEFEALRSEVAAELMPELYRKHARALADDVAKSNLPEKEKKRTLSALHRIIKEGRLAKNTTLDKPEQRQLTELVEAEAEIAIDKMQQDNKACNERYLFYFYTFRSNISSHMKGGSLSLLKKY